MPTPPLSQARPDAEPVPWTHQRAGAFLAAKGPGPIAGFGVGALAITMVLAAALNRAPPSPGDETLVDIPVGANFSQVVDTLEARGVLARPFLFRAYGRIVGLDRTVKAGTYRMRTGAKFADIRALLGEGRVVTHSITIPEGLTIRAMAGHVARAAGSDSNAVVGALLGGGDADSLHLAWGVPGPGLEGYLFPDTYRFAEGVGVARVVDAMVARYRRYWTPERRSALKASGLSERDAVTLASIIQAEAGHASEMSTISSVYHNRLRLGMRLQADPTVLYALGGHRPRLLYAAMDSVADHPYNTYARSGLPPGPICAPGADALDAALHPDETEYLYFVAHPIDGHVFSRSLNEHNAARRRIRAATEA